MRDEEFGFDTDEGWLGVARRAAEGEALGAIDGYTILDVCARGGQGVVYKARRDDGKLVALKRVHGGPSATAAARARLKGELAAAARVVHPGIVRAREIRANGDVLIEMPWVEGVTLTAWARDRQERAETGSPIEVFIAVCDALEAAHGAGVVHRDLKPSNILVDRGGNPFVLDFGLAKATAETAGTSSHATMTHQFVGTPAYAAPEQVSGGPEAVDERSDIYSLGVMLYEVMAGASPYPDDLSLGGLLHFIERGVPRRPRSVSRAVPRDVEAVILKAMARAPQDRYQSITELRTDLERCQSDVRTLAPRPGVLFDLHASVRRHPVRGAVIGALAVLILVTLGVVSTYAWRLRTAHAETARAHAAADRVGTFLSNLFLEGTQGDESRERATRILDDAAAWIDSEMGDDGWALARTNIAFGQMYAKIEAWTQAERHIAAALDTYRSLGASKRREVAEALRVLALAEAHLGEEGAKGHAREALSMATSLFDDSTLGLANYWATLGEVLMLDRSGESRAEADVCFARAVEILGGDEPRFPTWTGSVLTTQARSCLETGDTDIGIAILRRVLAMYDAHGIEPSNARYREALTLLHSAQGPGTPPGEPGTETSNEDGSGG